MPYHAEEASSRLTKHGRSAEHRVGCKHHFSTVRKWRQNTEVWLLDPLHDEVFVSSRQKLQMSAFVTRTEWEVRKRMILTEDKLQARLA